LSKKGMSGYSPDNLDLWKVNLAIVNENDKVLEISSTEDDIKEKLGGELMNPRSSLGKYFNENSFKDEESESAIHIIVQLPTLHIQCKVTNFDDDILTVMLIDRNEEQKEGILLLGQLKEWLLKHSLDRPGSTPMMRLEEKSQSTAKYIGDQEILPITGTGMLPRLVTISNKFWSMYRKHTPSLSYMRQGIVNGRPAIIACVHVPKGTPVKLPAEFEGYPVFINYGGVIEPASPIDLSPGISISSTSSCTLGALFKNETETTKTFMLTTKHSVGNTDSMVIQPGSDDASEVCTQ